MNGFVEFAGTVVPVLLPDPIAEFALGFRDRVGIMVQHHVHIGFGSHLVDKQVVIATGYVVDTGETFGAEEQFTFIGKISAYAHVWHARQGKRHVLQGRMKGFETDDFIEDAGLFAVSAITEHDLYAI